MWLKILIAVVILFTVLLFVPIIAHFSFNNGDFFLKLRYAILKFTILPQKPHIKKSDKKENNQAKGKHKKNSKNILKNSEKRKQVFEIGKIVLSNIPRFLKKIFKAIKIYDVEAYLRIGGEDAHTASENFVRYNQVINTLYSFSKNVITIDIKQFYIEPNFINEENSELVEAKLRIKPITLLSACFIFGVGFIIQYFKKIKNKYMTKGR